MNPLSAPLPAEFQDQMVRIFAENGTTGLLHMVLDFEAPLDPTILEIATRRLMEAEPILGCRFVEAEGEASWHWRDDLESHPSFRFHDAIEDVEAATRALIGAPFDPDDTPNLLVDLFRHAGGDRLALSVSHVIADGGAVLEVASRFATLYTALLEDAEHRLEINPASRDSFQWLKNFSFRNKFKIIGRDIGDIRRANRRHIGLTRSFESYKAAKRGGADYVSLEVGAERLREIDAVAKRHGLSRNDVLLAGFARAFAGFAGQGESGSVHIIMPSNLRRFMDADRRPAICNLGGIANVFVEPDIGPRFADTLERVGREMARQRKAFIGAGNPLAMRLLARLGLARKRKMIHAMMERGMRKPLPSTFTNVGRLTERRLTFGAGAPSHLTLLATPMSAPLTLIVALGYRSTLSLSMSYYEDDFERADVHDFLTNITATIEST